MAYTEKVFHSLLSWIQKPENTDILANLSGLTAEEEASISQLLSIFTLILNQSSTSSYSKSDIPDVSEIIRPAVRSQCFRPEYNSQEFYKHAYSVLQECNRHYQRTKIKLTAVYPELQAITLE